MAHKVEVDNLQVVHRAKLVKVKAELRANSSAAMALHQKQIQKVEAEHVKYIELYSGMVDAYNHEQLEVKRQQLEVKHQQLEVKRHKRQLRMTGDTVGRLSTTSRQRLIKMKELKDENNRHAARVADEELYMM